MVANSIDGGQFAPIRSDCKNDLPADESPEDASDDQVSGPNIRRRTTESSSPLLTVEPA